MIHEISVRSRQREELIDITPEVQKVIAASPLASGMVVCFVPHTTAGITINENADPDVRRDIVDKLHRDIPKDDGFHHGEGNSDAHVKACLIGFSQMVLFESRALVLGQWQAVYFCEFDGPRHRRVLLSLLPSA